MVSFDRQASDFDRRAGLPAGAPQRIAEALSALSPAEDVGVILDVGAGTGQIGEHLARGRVRYLGIDVSVPMLTIFRRKLDRSKLDRHKLGPGASGSLVRADAGGRWPIASASVDLIFLSRSAHLLPPAVLVEEALRVARPGGALIVFGGVQCQPGSLRVVLRRKMRRLLAEHGVEPRCAGKERQRIIESLEKRGAEPLPVATAAAWNVVERTDSALAAWRAKAGLAGRAVTPEIQNTVLSQLEEWIRDRYGKLDVARDATEHYDLTAIRLPKTLSEPANLHWKEAS